MERQSAAKGEVLQPSWGVDQGEARQLEAAGWRFQCLACFNLRLGGYVDEMQAVAMLQLRRGQRKSTV